MNGLEVARSIKALPRRIAVVLVSLHDTPAYRSASASLADGFVAKDALDIHLAPLISRLFPIFVCECGAPNMHSSTS
jgi:DNA-binding NarL/FixJ family response regulator